MAGLCCMNAADDPFADLIGRLLMFFFVLVFFPCLVGSESKAGNIAIVHFVHNTIFPAFMQSCLGLIRRIQLCSQPGILRFPDLLMDDVSSARLPCKVL